MVKREEDIRCAQSVDLLLVLTKMGAVSIKQESKQGKQSKLRVPPSVGQICPPGTKCCSSDWFAMLQLHESQQRKSATTETQSGADAVSVIRNMQATAFKAARTATQANRKAQTTNVAEHPWEGPGNVMTFLRCLRLLDLDPRDDWPSVHEQLFLEKVSQQNLQQRVKCVEWTLYCLFEIWDPAYTKYVRRGLLSLQGRWLICCSTRNFVHSFPRLPLFNR
jgi:hypothetical protein